MSGEYISREAAKGFLCDFCIANELCTRNGDCFVMTKFKAIPAADVVEVKHGRWLWDGGDDMHYYCSCCHHNAYGCTGEILDGKYNYCPSCGAKMDGKSADYAPAKPYDLLYEEGGPDA